MRRPGRAEAGNPFVGAERGEEAEGTGSGSEDGSAASTESITVSVGERSRVGSLVEEGSEFGEWIGGSWEDEGVIRVARLYGEDSE